VNIIKHGGKRRNAGRKRCWNTYDKSTVIRVPEILAKSLENAKNSKVDLNSLVNEIENVTKSMKLISVENVTES